MHRWARAITAGAGGAALVVASFGAGLSPAGAQPHDDADADADAAVWNDQFATVDIETGGEASTGDNVATSLNGNLVLIHQGATADADLLAESRDEILGWFYSEGFADWSGAEGLVDTGFSVIPGSPVVLPVVGGSATNLIETINQTAAGIAEITSGAASVSNTTGVDVSQDFSGNEGATATADATGGEGDADADADATVGNTQTAHVGVSSGGSASSGGNRATTANGNAVVIGQGASADAGASINGNASDGGGGGSVTGGTASNTVGSVTNSAQGQASVSTGAATVSNSTNVSVTQSNTGNGGATSTATATGPEG
jgi:hypothetical protein